MSTGWRSRREGRGKHDTLKSRVRFEFTVDALYYHHIEPMILNTEGGPDDTTHLSNDAYIASLRQYLCQPRFEVCTGSTLYTVIRP